MIKKCQMELSTENVDANRPMAVIHRRRAVALFVTCHIHKRCSFAYDFHFDPLFIGARFISGAFFSFIK